MSVHLGSYLVLRYDCLLWNLNAGTSVQSHRHVPSRGIDLAGSWHILTISIPFDRGMNTRKLPLGEMSIA